MKKIIGVLLTAAAFFLMSAQVSAEEQGYIRWGYTPDGCWYQESILNEDYGFRFEKGENCEFSCEWEMCRQCYAELGLKLPGMIRTEDITGLYVEYEAEMRLTGNNYFGLHCKMRDLPGMTAAKEIFTVEAWGTWRPPGGGTLITSDRVDGALYDYYYTLRVNQPTVEGVRDCEQFWCVRKEASGIADRRMYYKEKLPLSQHFRTLQRVGAIYPDEMPESAALYLDCYDGDGDGFLHVIKADYHLSYTAQVTTAPVTTAVTTTTTTTTTTTVPAVTVPKKAADADGCYFRSDFENGSDRWQTRGKARLRHDESNYVDGHSSLRVTDRQDYGSGVGFFLTPYAVGPDETYSVRVCVMQKADELMNLRLYFDCPGINGMCIADAWAIRGQWTVLESTFSVEHYIPDGNEVLRLYIEADSPDADFYIDAAGFWDEGCMPELDISAAVSDFVPQTVQHTESDDGLELRRHQNDTYTYVYGGGGVKDLVGPYFRAGFCTSADALQEPEMQEFYRKHFNSVTCRTEMLPETVIREVGESSVTVSLEAADPVLKYAEQNGLGVRGCALVNGSSMPEEMLSGSREEREMRLESLIRETFAKLKADYPSLDLYAYDVCRNVIPQEPFVQEPEWNEEDLYGEDPFGEDLYGADPDETEPDTESAWEALPEEERIAYIIAAFRYARAYAPENCKLFLSVENIFHPAQQEIVCSLIETIRDAGDYIDGIAVQGHLVPCGVLYDYEMTLLRLASMGLDIQITEFLENMGEDMWLWETAATDLMGRVVICSEAITSVTFYEPVYGERPGMHDESCLFDAALRPDILLIMLTFEMRGANIYDAETLLDFNPDPVPHRIGDVDGSGVTDYDDALLLLRFLTEDDGVWLSEQALQDADLNQDGLITLIDLRWLLTELC